MHVQPIIATLYITFNLPNYHACPIFALCAILFQFTFSLFVPFCAHIVFLSSFFLHDFAFQYMACFFFCNDIFHFKRAMKWFSLILAKQYTNIKWRAQMGNKKEIVFRVCVWDKGVMKRRPLSCTSYHMKLASTKNTDKF